MIKKNEEQFDSGGIILKHTFLMPFREVHNGWGILTDNITEEMVDEIVKEKSQDFESDFKVFLMFKLGYDLNENGKWIKK